MNTLLYLSIIIVPTLYFIIFRIYYYPNVKCFFGSHNYRIRDRYLNGIKEPVSLQCRRKNCSSYYIKGISKWYFINGYRGGE